jgi:hypothetical protein
LLASGTCSTAHLPGLCDSALSAVTPGIRSSQRTSSRQRRRKTGRVWDRWQRWPVDFLGKPPGLSTLETSFLRTVWKKKETQMNVTSGFAVQPWLVSTLRSSCLTGAGITGEHCYAWPLKFSFLFFAFSCAPGPHLRGKGSATELYPGPTGLLTAILDGDSCSSGTCTNQCHYCTCK